VLLLLQSAVTPPLPPIHVTVQQPPGLPFWETALVAALFGILTSILMEVLKPWIGRKLTRRMVLKHLDQEFRNNYALVLDLSEIAEYYRGATTEGRRRAESIVEDLWKKVFSRDRFDQFKNAEKLFFYEVVGGSDLAQFYVELDEAMKTFTSYYAWVPTLKAGERYMRARKMSEVTRAGWLADRVMKNAPPPPSAENEKVAGTNS
jgi:hypothetical protein